MSARPVWELAAGRVVRGRLVLPGDAAHMASPRTGAGAYTAMVDAVVLGRELAGGGTLGEALEGYNDDTVGRGRDLYRRSRQAANNFAPPGREVVSPADIAQRR